MSGKLRCLIVDDSIAYRMFIKRVLDSIDSCEVVGQACDGVDALQKVLELGPDIITLDLEMPKRDGLEFLLDLKETGSDAKVVVVSSIAKRDGENTIKALKRGAFDFITKPTSRDPRETEKQLRTDLERFIDTVHYMANTGASGPKEQQSNIAVPDTRIESVVPKSPPVQSAKFDVIAIGISTGGPEALSKVFKQLPGHLNVPILIVQHMPATFTKNLADALNAKSELKVKEAEHGEILKPNVAYLAPGGTQMKLRKSGFDVSVVITDDPPELFCKPSVNYLFESIAEIYGKRTLAIIMTGLGADGVRGLTLLKQKNATVYSQDKESCSVWGMPGAAVGAGLVDQEIPLMQIPVRISQAVLGTPTHDPII